MYKIAIALCGFIAAFSVQSKDFYIDPNKGSLVNPGTAESPWKTLSEVINNRLIQTKDQNGNVINPNAPVKAGDVLILRTGFHGDVYIRNAYNDSLISVIAEPNNTPMLASLRVDSASNWLFKGLRISVSFAERTGGDMVLLGSNTWFGPLNGIQLVDSIIYTSENIETLWTSADWASKSANGITIASGNNILVQNNYIYNVKFGINIGSLNSVVSGNVISFFTADGIRISKDYVTVKDNVIVNNLKVDSNHDDGIQLYGGTKNIKILGNVIYQKEMNNELSKELQGVGLFDGPLSDITIQGNVINVWSWHGIGLYDATLSTIQGNYIYSESPDTKARITLGTKNKGGNSYVSIMNNYAQDYVYQNYNAENCSFIDNKISEKQGFYERLKNEIDRINQLYGALPGRKNRFIFPGNIETNLNINDLSGTQSKEFSSVSASSIMDKVALNDDNASVVVGRTVVISVLSNDVNVGNLSISNVTQGTRGIVTNNGSSVSYRAGNKTGSDSFTYSVKDMNNNVHTATVNIQVTKK